MADIEEKPLVSVIIPAYNVARYIGRCLKSVLAQTYERLEIIVVDDGSTDGSGDMAKAEAERDERVIVLSKENGGVGSARNLGLEKARGEWVFFLDADDYLSEDCIGRLYRDAEEKKADIAVCGDLDLLDNLASEEEKARYKPWLSAVKRDRVITDKAELFRDCFLSGEIYTGVVWGKLIKRELAQKVRFSSLQYGEDTLYVLQLFSFSPVVVLNSFIGYYYVQRPESAMGSGGVANVTMKMQHLVAFAYAYRECLAMSEEMRQLGAREFARIVYGTLSVALKQKTKDGYRENRKKLAEYAAEIMGGGQKIPFSYAFLLRFFLRFPRLFWTVLHPIWHMIRP